MAILRYKKTISNALKIVTLSIVVVIGTKHLAVAQKIPHEFQPGSPISAQQMNENFQVAASKLRKGTVDCATEKISDKLKEFNYLVIQGICTENLNIDWINRDVPENWQWDNMTALTSMVLLVGNSEDGLDEIKAEFSDTPVIRTEGQLALGLMDLKITNGEGVKGDWGAMIGLKRVTIQGSSKAGLNISRGIGYVEESTFDDNEHGIVAEYNSSLKVVGSNINNSNRVGIGVWHGSNALIGDSPEKDQDGVLTSDGNVINGAEVGTWVADSSFVKMIGNEVRCYTNTGVGVSEASTLDLGVDWDQAEYDDDGTNPLSYLNSNYGTNKLLYGNLIDGTECNGITRRNWHHGVQVREASVMRMFRTITENNNQHGIYAEGNSSITLGGGNEIKNNGRHGLSLNETTLNQWSHHQELEPTVISGNGEDAFDLASSTIHLNGGRISNEVTDETISDSNRMVISGHRNGINARNSRITLQRVDIQDNAQTGIRLTDNSVLNVWRDGATITGNGLDTNDWDGFAPGLQLDKNSSASIDRLEVSGNGRGILVERGSVIDGGWKNDNDPSLPDYMIEIKNNKLWGLEVNKGSTVNLRNLEVSGNSKTPKPNENGQPYATAINIGDASVGDLRDSLITDNAGRAISIRGNSKVDLRNVIISGNSLTQQTNGDGSSYYAETLRIDEGSTGSLRSSTVTGNGGQVIDIRNNSKFNINETTIAGNGLSDDSGEFSFRGINVQNHSHLDFDNSTLTHNTKDTALEITNYSIGHINNVDITNTNGRAFNAWRLADVGFNNGNIDSSDNDCIGIGESRVGFNNVSTIKTGGVCINALSYVYFNNITSLEVTNGDMHINDISQVDVHNSQISSKYGINLRNASSINVRDSTITATYVEGDNSNGANGIEASRNSKISIGAWGNSGEGSIITGVAFPLKVRDSSQLEIFSPVNLTSNLGWNEIQVEQGSSLDVGGDESMPVQDVSYTIQLQQETKANLSDKWKFGQINCSNHNDMNNNPIYRNAVIYRNSSPTADEGIDGNCIIAN